MVKSTTSSSSAKSCKSRTGRPKTELGMIAVTELVTLKRNPQYLTPKQMDALKESIHRDGFCAPILVRPGKGGRYEVISGNHRLMAAAEVGMKTVPCVVTTNMSDRAAKRLAINLNTIHGEPSAELLAPFLADLDAATLLDIHVENDMKEALFAFDEELARRLSEMTVPKEFDHASPQHSNVRCTCPKCGAVHRKADED